MMTNALAAPIEKLLLVDEITRMDAVAFESLSLPGHLLHIVTAGAVDQWSEGNLELRLGYARGLVQHSDLPMTEIAMRLGYARSQELSRDYRLRFQITPRDDRNRAPVYKGVETKI